MFKCNVHLWYMYKNMPICMSQSPDAQRSIFWYINKLTCQCFHVRWFSSAGMKRGKSCCCWSRCNDVQKHSTVQWVLGYTFSLRMYPGGVKIAKRGRNDTYTDPSVNGFLRETVYQVYTTTTGIHIYMSRGHSWSGV